MPFEVFTWLISLTTLAMLVVLAQRLMSGHWRNYRLLTVMVAVNLLGSAPPLISFATAGALWALPNAKVAYWVLTFTFEALLFALVLQQLWQTREAIPSRAGMVRVLSIAAGLAGCAVFYIHSQNKRGVFMGLAARDLTFIAAILTMVLWTQMLQLRKRDRTRLMVCLGIGVQSAGDAVAHSIRLLGREYTQAGNAFFMVGSALSAFLLMQAFRRPYYMAASDPERRRSSDAPETARGAELETSHGEQASIH